MAGLENISVVVSSVASLIAVYVGLSIKAAIGPMLETQKHQAKEIGRILNDQSDQWNHIRASREEIVRLQERIHESCGHLDYHIKRQPREGGSGPFS